MAPKLIIVAGTSQLFLSALLGLVPSAVISAVNFFDSLPNKILVTGGYYRWCVFLGKLQRVLPDIFQSASGSYHNIPHWLFLGKHSNNIFHIFHFLCYLNFRFLNRSFSDNR